MADWIEPLLLEAPSQVKEMANSILYSIWWANKSSLAEAVAVSPGMHFALDCGFREVEVESDCLVVISAICNPSPNFSYLDRVVKEILGLVCSFSLCHAYFASRSCNLVAHTLAKWALKIPEEVWLEYTPLCHPRFCCF